VLGYHKSEYPSGYSDFLFFFCVLKKAFGKLL